VFFLKRNNYSFKDPALLGRRSLQKRLKKKSLAEGKFSLMAFIKSGRGGFSIAGDNAGHPQTTVPTPSSHLLPSQMAFRTPGYLGAWFVVEGDALTARPSLATCMEQDGLSLDHGVGQRRVNSCPLH